MRHACMKAADSFNSDIGREPGQRESEALEHARRVCAGRMHGEKKQGCEKMKLEKVNENQICCTLTREDLENRQIRISELAYGSDKAKRLFRDMIQQANYEFGFEPGDLPIMVEAIPMSEESIVILITKVEYPEELDARFSDFSGMEEEEETLLEASSQPSIPGADDIIDYFRRLCAEQGKEQPSKPEGKPTDTRRRTSSKEASEASDIARIFEFADLEQVIQFAHVVKGYYDGENSLYRNARESGYELVLYKGAHSPEEFNRVCNVASEYARSRKSTPAILACYDEHAQLILKDHALRTLDEL